MKTDHPLRPAIQNPFPRQARGGPLGLAVLRISRGDRLTVPDGRLLAIATLGEMLKTQAERRSAGIAAATDLEVAAAYLGLRAGRFAIGPAAEPRAAVT